MKYKILKRIQNGQSTVGYQLLSEDGKTLNIPKNQVMQAAYQGLVVNAIYNKHTKSLSGTNGTDLRSLPVIQYSEILKNKEAEVAKANGTNNDKVAVKSNKTEVDMTNKATKSRHQMADSYINKAKSMGIPTPEFQLLPNDRVKLKRLPNLGNVNSGVFVVPSFVSEIEDLSHDRVGYDFKKMGCGLSLDCDVSEIDFSQTKILPKSLRHWFSNMKSRSIKIVGLDTTELEDMGRLFQGCSYLESIDISSIHTSACLEKMDAMFAYCYRLKSLDISHLFTVYVDDFSYMFCGCNSLESLNIDISGYRVRLANNMFCDCYSLKSLDISSLRCGYIRTAENMFADCHSLESIKFGDGWSTDLLENTRNMFINCKSLKELDLSSICSVGLRRADSMFENCSNLEYLDLRNFRIWDRCLDNGMFKGCPNLKTIICPKGFAKKYEDNYYLYNRNGNVVIKEAGY